MKFNAGYMACFDIKCENVQDEMWLDQFLKGIYKHAKSEKQLKIIDDMFAIGLEDCVTTDKQGREIPVNHCSISEYAGKNGWSYSSFPKSLDFIGNS